MEDKKLLEDQLDEESTDLQKEDEQTDEKDLDSKEDKQEEKTFTQSELDEIVAKRIAREKKSILSEAEKLAKMTEDERNKFELEKQRDELQKEKAQIERQKLELEAVKILNKENLPVEFASVLLADTAEETKSNISAFKDTFQKAVEAQVAEKLKGGYTPKKDSGQASPITVKQFKEMGYEERSKLLTENRELYDQLQKESRK